MRNALFVLTFFIPGLGGCDSSFPRVPDPPPTGMYVTELAATPMNEPSEGASVGILGIRRAKGGMYLDLAVSGTEAEHVGGTIAANMLWESGDKYLVVEQNGAPIVLVKPHYRTGDYVSGFHFAPPHISDYQLAPAQRVDHMAGREVRLEPVILATTQEVSRSPITIGFTPEFQNILKGAMSKDLRGLPLHFDPNPRTLVPRE